MKKFFITISLIICALSLYAKDIQELVVTTTPPMSCQNCENKIKKGDLRFLKGVKNIETSIPDQRVTVTYDADKTNPEKIEAVFNKIGYKVDVIEENGTTICPEGTATNQPACCQQKEACCNPGGECCKK